MEKIIALGLAMLMVLSIIPLAFAENETVNETTDIVEDSVDDVNETALEEPETEEPVDTIVIISGDQTEEPETDTNVTGEPELEEPEVELDENVAEEAGITPDSPLYGLERAIERISLALTLGKSAKAKKGLAHARERLMEVQAMIAAKRMEKAGIAQEAYEETMEEVEENIAELGDGDAVEELQDGVEIEDALAENEELVQATNNLKLKVKGLSDEQEAQLAQIVSSLEESTSKAKVQVQVKKNKTKIKIKAQGEMTDEEVAQIETQVREAVQAGEKAKIQIKIKAKKAKGADNEVESESEDEDGTEDNSDDDETGSVNAAAAGKPGKTSKGKGNK